MLDQNQACYVGIDIHRYEHTAVAADRFEEEKACLSFANTPEGIKAFLLWLDKLVKPNQDCVIGMEGANGNGRQLCSFLIPRYQEIYEVNPIQTKQRRDHHTSKDKSDPIDAGLIVEVLTRRLDKLPKITKQDRSAVLRDREQLLLFHEDITRQTTRLKNQLHQLFHEENSQYHLTKGTPFAKKSLDRWQRYAEYHSHRCQNLNCFVIKKKIKQLKQLMETRKQIDEKINLSFDQVPEKNLLTLPGAGYLTAAKITVAVKGVKRFKNLDAFVKYAGIAPIARSSGKSQRHKQDKAGNRRLNTAIYTIALTQIRCLPVAKAYFAKKVREGKSKKHALRCVMKRTACIVYGMLKNKEDYRN